MSSVCSSDRGTIDYCLPQVQIGPFTYLGRYMTAIYYPHYSCKGYKEHKASNIYTYAYQPVSTSQESHCMNIEHCQYSAHTLHTHRIMSVLTVVVRFGSAPFLRRISTILTYPFWLAINSGVVPSYSSEGEVSNMLHYPLLTVIYNSK